MLDLDLKAVAFGADVALFDVSASGARSAAGLVRSLNPDIATVAVAVTEVGPDRNHVHAVLRKLEEESRSQGASLLLEDPLALRSG